MITVSSIEFRTNQKTYLDQVAQGIELLITRKKDAFKITRVAEDDTLMSKEDFFAQVERGIADAVAGNTFTMSETESIDDFMNRMELEGNV